MVEAAHTASELGTWIDDEVFGSLERSLGELPDLARILQDLAVWAGTWGWARYEIEQLGQPFRIIQLAAELIAEKNGGETPDAMRILVDCLAGFESASEDSASVSPFVRCVIDVCGTFDRREVSQLRSRGFGDQEIAEIAGAVALTLFVSLLSDAPDRGSSSGVSMAFAG